MSNKKDAYYFSHDANARNDVKILKLRRKLKGDGYAIYFMLIEVLREQKDHKIPFSALPELSFDFKFPLEKIDRVIKDFELFKVEEGFFYSQRLLDSMRAFNDHKTRLSELGKKGNEKRWGKKDGGDDGVKRMVI